MTVFKKETIFMTDINSLIKNLILGFVLLGLSLPLLADETQINHETTDYTLPDVTVLRQDGKKIAFIKEIDDGRPVILNFIFASCSAICPMLSHTFSQVQAKLGSNDKRAHLMSISIDPENDTPAKLTQHAKKFGAGTDWDHYTGTTESSTSIQKAFNVYRGDKMNHTSVILLRAAPGKPWLRLEGFVSPDKIMSEYHNLKQQ